MEEEGNTDCNEVHDITDLAVCLMNFSTDVKEPGNFLITIDTGSSAFIFKNEKLVKDITPTKRTFKLITNCRSMRSRRIGTFEGMKVWVNKLFIANILSLS